MSLLRGAEYQRYEYFNFYIITYPSRNSVKVFVTRQFLFFSHERTSQSRKIGVNHF